MQNQNLPLPTPSLTILLVPLVRLIVTADVRRRTILAKGPLLTSAELKSIPCPLLLPGYEKNQPNCRGDPRYLQGQRAGNGNGIERRFGVCSLRDTNCQKHQGYSEGLVSAVLHYYMYDA